MRYFSSVVAGPIFITLLICQGCSPTLNWRDVRAEPSPLLALFPCKPERHTRTVALAAHSVTMTMLSCDADGATLTLAYADLKDVSLVPAALAHWQVATLGNIQAGPVVKQSFSFKGVSALPPPVQSSMRSRPAGSNSEARYCISLMSNFAMLMAVQPLLAVFVVMQPLAPQAAGSFVGKTAGP